MKIFRLLPFVLLLSFLIVPVFAPDVPYSHAPGVTTCDFSGSTFPSEWGEVNGQNGELVNGQTDSDFNGLTLTSIGVYLCLSIGANNPPNPPTAGQTFVTIAVFDSAGNIVSSFGTVDISTLPIAYSGHNTNAQEFTKTGSHVMQAGEIIGITFNDILHGSPGYQIQTFCGEQCDPNTNPQPNGQIVDCSAIANCGNSFRYAFAGDFLFGGSPPPSNPKPTVTASPFVAVIFIVSVFATVNAKTPKDREVGVSAVIGTGIIFIFLVAAGL